MGVHSEPRVQVLVNHAAAVATVHGVRAWLSAAGKRDLMPGGAGRGGAATAALFAGFIGLASQAAAQSTNYSEVEQLFGEPITTSATGSPLRQSEAPVTMDIVTADDIQRSGARTIPEILERLSGLDVFSWSNNSADVAVRGLNQGTSNRLLLLINGHEQYTDALGTIVYQLLPVRLDEIRQIEVIKGPNSALYGFNAAAGVINIITYSPRYDHVNVERGSGGSNDYFEGSLVPHRKLGQRRPAPIHRIRPNRRVGVPPALSARPAGDQGRPFHHAHRQCRSAATDRLGHRTPPADELRQFRVARPSAGALSLERVRRIGCRVDHVRHQHWHDRRQRQLQSLRAARHTEQFWRPRANQ